MDPAHMLDCSNRVLMFPFPVCNPAPASHTHTCARKRTKSFPTVTVTDTTRKVPLDDDFG